MKETPPTFKIDLVLTPWTTPSFVILSDEGTSQKIKAHVNQVSDEILNAMCNRFRAEIFRKAKQKDRWT